MEDSVHTAFGLWEYTVMPFGLTNAPATCHRQNDDILREYLGKFVVCYLDDILVFSSDVKEHEKHVPIVLQALSKVDSRLKISKCEFGVTETTLPRICYPSWRNEHRP